jgi:hypothetical protein
MSIYIFANVTRASATISTKPIEVQLDSMNQQQAAAYGGASSGEGPYFRSWGVTWDYITLQQGDLLTDTTNLDAKTGALTKWRIIGDPEYMPDTHIEFCCDRVVGT